MDIRNKIKKIVLALNTRKKIVKIDKKQNYSLKKKKLFNVYTVKVTTIEEITRNREIAELRKVKGRNAEQNNRLLQLLEEREKTELKAIECFNLVDVLKYLVEVYKSIKGKEV